WLAEALALQGHVDEAIEVFTAHAEASNHLGLLAEELDPRDRTQLGNFPQAFSHLGLINAALRLDLALRMRDEGSEDIPRVTDRLETPRGRAASPPTRRPENHQRAPSGGHLGERPPSQTWTKESEAPLGGTWMNARPPSQSWTKESEAPLGGHL